MTIESVVGYALGLLTPLVIVALLFAFLLFQSERWLLALRRMTAFIESREGLANRAVMDG